jgi:hypothetical protein
LTPQTSNVASYSLLERGLRFRSHDPKAAELRTLLLLVSTVVHDGGPLQENNNSHVEATLNF